MYFFIMQRIAQHTQKPDTRDNTLSFINLYLIIYLSNNV